MTDYTFSTLNDKEFEILSTDILSKFLGIKVERFKGGRDGGVDGRFFFQLRIKKLLFNVNII